MMQGGGPGSGSGPACPALFGLVIDAHGEHLLSRPAESGPHLPAALSGSETSGSAPLVYGVEFIDVDNEVGLRHELPSEVDGEALRRLRRSVTLLAATFDLPHTECSVEIR